MFQLLTPAAINAKISSRSTIEKSDIKVKPQTTCYQHDIMPRQGYIFRQLRRFIFLKLETLTVHIIKRLPKPGKHSPSPKGEGWIFSQNTCTYIPAEQKSWLNFPYKSHIHIFLFLVFSLCSDIFI